MSARPPLAAASRGVLMVAALGLAGVSAGPSGLAAQEVRGWVGSNVQVVELRPMELVAGSWVSGVEQRSAAATQDFGLTAWGLGAKGLSSTLLLRTRQRLGSDYAWPRSDDDFDALLAYAQYVRGRLRARAGRQEIRSGLGFSSFDGATLSLIGARTRVEAYGGRSLARGLRDPERDALRGIEDFVPDQSVDLFGGAAAMRAFGLSMTARYQREILRDRSGLSAERGSFDFSTALPGAFVTGSLDYDFAFGQVGKGALTMSVPLAGGVWNVQGSLRRYVPYFSLSTIWGFFEPVDYREAVLRVAWSGNTRFGAWASGGVRQYGDTETAVILRALEDVGRRASAGARWQASATFVVDGSYRLEWGPGGFLNSADVAGRWSPSDNLGLTLSATSFQQIEQFRLGDGRAVGGGFSFDGALTDRWGVMGGMSVLRHRGDDGAAGSPWNQGRAWLSLRAEIGRDPGLIRGGLR